LKGKVVLTKYFQCLQGLQGPTNWGAHRCSGAYQPRERSSAALGFAMNKKPPLRALRRNLCPRVWDLKGRKEIGKLEEKKKGIRQEGWTLKRKSKKSKHEDAKLKNRERIDSNHMVANRWETSNKNPPLWESVEGGENTKLWLQGRMSEGTEKREARKETVLEDSTPSTKWKS